MKLFKWLQASLILCLALFGLASCKKEEPITLVDTFYQSQNVRVAAADGVNKNHTSNTYKLELYSNNTYVITYTQCNAFTALDMTYGRIITSEGTYKTTNTTEDSNTYELDMPTHVTLAAFSRSKIHTYADSANWNKGNEAEGIDPGVSYKLYDYGKLETYKTVDEFISHFGKKYLVTTDNKLKNMEAKVVDGSQVEIALIGM